MKIPWSLNTLSNIFIIGICQRVLCKLYPRDSRYSEDTSGSQYTKILNESEIYHTRVSQGILTGSLIYLGFFICQSSEFVLETTFK